MFCVGPWQMSRVLIAGFTVSSGYLAFKLYERYKIINEKQTANIPIFPNSETYKVAFPSHLELLKVRPVQEAQSFCTALTRQIQTDWNRFVDLITRLNEK